jgi:hypothetical protein
MDSLGALEERLRHLSHATDALDILREYAQRLGKTKHRQATFNAPGALVTSPAIRYDEALRRNLISEDEDPFVLLQGDIIRTDAAYFLGERLVGMYFVVANSTCDLVPGRRDFALLLPVRPIHPGETTAEREETKKLVSELLAFKSTRRMYLPPLVTDAADVLANAIEFDGLAQIRMEDLSLAHRVASLSLVGWRIFGSHLRGVLTRAGESEVNLRSGWSAGSYSEVDAGETSGGEDTALPAS